MLKSNTTKLLLCLMLISSSIVYSQSYVIDSTDRRNVISFSFESEKCDSLSKVKDNAIEGLKQANEYNIDLLENQKQQISLLEQNRQFDKDIISGLTNRLTKSEKKRMNLKIGCVSIGIIAILELSYIGVQRLK